MKTLKELYSDSVNLYGEGEAKKLLRSFYKQILSLPGVTTEVLNDLNQRTNSRYRATSTASRKYILSRIREGYTVQDLIHVNEIMAKKWLGTDQQSFLRPSTLYNSEKFEGYLAEWSRSEAKKQENSIRKQKVESLSRPGNSEAKPKGFKAWFSFPAYDALWTYCCQMADDEFHNYDLPLQLREIQSKWLLAKFNKEKGNKIENLFSELKEKIREDFRS